jgi:hypothetical protein
MLNRFGFRDHVWSARIILISQDGSSRCTQFYRGVHRLFFPTVLLLFCNLRFASKRQVAILWRISLANLELLFAIEIGGGFISRSMAASSATIAMGRKMSSAPCE